MLIKIALVGIKGKLKDYLILFSGLIAAAGIFYMFQFLANNQELMGESGHTTSFTIIFQLGTVLLGIITFFYLVYANHFLMDINKKDYALLMMLGANKTKIIWLNIMETMGVGLVSTTIGVLFGVVLSKGVHLLLVKSLALETMRLSAFNGTAFRITLLFFLACFIMTAAWNTNSLVKEKLINLIKKSATPEPVSHRISFLVATLCSGVLCLAISYWAMNQVQTLKIKAIGLAMMTIIFGTYLVINSLFILVLSGLRKWRGFYYKRLNAVLVAQLTYRIKAYTQILTVITILFALAMGALSVGMGFKNEAFKIADKVMYYDLVATKKQAMQFNQLRQQDISRQVTYRYKIKNDYLYFDRYDLEKQPLIVNGPINVDGKTKQSKYAATDIETLPVAQQALLALIPNHGRVNRLQVSSQPVFNEIKAPIQTVILIKTTNFKQHYPILKAIVTKMGKRNGSLQSNQKVDRYNVYEKNLVGFEYMGFFLGIAFLTMLVSCLMFKILTGYKVDEKRYRILDKLGATGLEIKRVIRTELFYVFSIPAMIGTIHVLFGLKLFKMLLSNPYDTILQPILIFMVIYFIYFIITFRIYVKLIFARIKA